MSLDDSEKTNDSASRSQQLSKLRDRLEKYKLKDQLVTQREKEIENALIEKEKLEKEREAIRIETEKQALILELQRVSSTKPKPKPPAPKPVPAQPAPTPSFFNSGAMSFGYPGSITEKEAIDWLRNGF